MATTIDPPVPDAPGAGPVKHPKRRLRKLEKRLSIVQRVEVKRARQLDKATLRSAALEADIAELRAGVPPKAAKRRSPGVAKANTIRGRVSRSPATGRGAKASGQTPTVLRAFCLRERKTVEMHDPKPMVMKNGRSATVGTCPSCGARLIRPG